MTRTNHYWQLSMLSGFWWGLLGSAMGFLGIGEPILGGLIAAPAIGLAIGLLCRSFHKLPKRTRVLLSLASLYLAASLFGMAIGFYDLLMMDRPGRIASAVVLQGVFGVLWGLTFTGLVFILWPIAFINHQALMRSARVGGVTRVQAPLQKISVSLEDKMSGRFDFVPARLLSG